MEYNKYTSNQNPSLVDILTKSLERLSIYDGQGKARMLQVSSKADFLKIIGGLNLSEIQDRM